MDIKQLQSMGAMVPKTLFKREVEIKRPVALPQEEWEDPEVPEFTDEVVTESMTTYIRKRNSADFMEIVGASNVDKVHVMVLRCICDEEGNPVFENVEQVKQLQEWLFVPLFTAVNEVNEVSAKNSQPRTKSGASLPSPSAAAPSRNGSSRSVKKNMRSGSSTGASAAP